LDSIPVEELSLHILDLVENCISAGAKCVEIRVRENWQEDLLLIEITDDGSGMSEGVLKTARDPFFTTRTTRRVGLGLPLFEQAARMAGGEVEIESRPGAGTKVTGVFKYRHLDRQPLGDIAGTLLSLVVGNPQTEFVYFHQTDEGEISFSSREVKAHLGGKPINSPEGIAGVRKSLNSIRQRIRG
jgi:anti-sigma regulatory factor (Ser/Thr protein kinase)